MTKDEILSLIKSNISGNAEEIKNVLNYISCENNEEPQNLDTLSIKLNNDNFPYKDFFKIEENKEIEKRLFKIFSRADSERFIEIIIDDEIRYNCYYSSNINKNIVSREITYNLYRHLKYLRSHVIDEGALNYLKGLIDKPSKYYEDVLFRDVFKFDKYESTRQIASIMIMAQKIKSHEKKYERFIPDLERIVYSTIKYVYSDDIINPIFDNYIKNEDVKNYYKSFEPVNLVFRDLEYLIVLYLVSYMCSDVSILIHNAFKICFIMWSLALERVESDSELERIYQKYSIPDETIIKYYLLKLYKRLDLGYSDILEYIKKLDDFGLKSADSCMNLLDYFIKTNIIEYSHYIITLLGMLLRYDKLKKDKDYYIEIAEKILIENAFDKNKYEEIKKLLKKQQLSNDEIKNLCLYTINFNRHVICLFIFILDYSTVAKNMLKVALAKNKGLCSVNLFGIYRYFKYDNNLNLYISLYKNVQMSFKSIVKVYLFNDWYYKSNNDEFLQFLILYKKEAELAIEELNDYNLMKYFKILYEKGKGFDIKYVVEALYKGDKQLVEYSKELLKANEKEARPYVEQNLNNKSKPIRDIAFCLLRYWDNQHSGNDLDKINDINEMITYIEKFYDKLNKKNVPYENEIDYTNIRQLNSNEKVPEILTKFYISEYILQKDLYISKICEKIKVFVNKDDFKSFIDSIYNFWVTDNYRTKYKNIIIPYALILDDYGLLEFKNQIQYWGKNKKVALAEFSVKPLCLNGSRMALFLTSLIAKSIGKARIKAAATSAINSVLDESNITQDEFDDLIIPSLGFNECGEKIFDYGNRKFKGILNKDLKIIFYDSDYNEIKSLPRYSVRKCDNESLVSKCKEDLKYTRKQITTIINNQKSRMFKAVVTLRKWKVENWKKIFIDNSIMAYFAISLVWEEVDCNEKSIGTFRYMEDRTFNSINEEEYTLSNNTYIRLLNVANFNDECINKWKQQFEDYEIKQPIEQLNMPIYKLNDENKAKEGIDVFKDNKVYFQIVKGVLNKTGLVTENIRFNEIKDCCSYVFTDDRTDIKIFIDLATEDFELAYNTVCSIFKIRFKTGKENSKEKTIPLSKVPKRLLSLAMYIGNKVFEKRLKD